MDPWQRAKALPMFIFPIVCGGQPCACAASSLPSFLPQSMSETRESGRQPDTSDSLTVNITRGSAGWDSNAGQVTRANCRLFYCFYFWCMWFSRVLISGALLLVFPTLPGRFSDIGALPCGRLSLCRSPVRVHFSCVRMTYFDIVLGLVRVEAAVMCILRQFFFLFLCVLNILLTR